MSQGFNNLDFNNIYRNWIQGQIETANARGLMGGQTPGQIINQDLVRPIDNIMNQARIDMRNPNRGILVGNQGLVGRGPTSISTPKQLPAVTTGSNIVNPNARIPKVQPRVNTPNVINIYPNNDIKLLTYDPSKKIVDPSLGKQISYRLPNGTYTSNPDLVNLANQQIARAKDIAKQQIAKANRKALLRAAGKGAGIVPTAIEFYKDIAFPVANDLYQGFIMGNPDKSKTLQAALGLAGIDRNGNKIPRKPKNTSTNNGNDTGVPFEILDDNQFTGGKSVQVNSKSGQKSGQPTTQAQALALAQQLGGVPMDTQQEAGTQQANIDAINDYVSRLQEINQPYIESLQRFADNYGDLYNQNQLYNRRMRDLSAITGSPLWYQSAKDYNPIEVEATKIDLQKKIQDAQAGDLNAINEIMGNLAMAQEMGLPPEAAFANKNLLTMMAARDREANKYQIALENNLMKKYGIDRNYARALTVQAMRGQNALDVAGMYTGAYNNGGGVAPGLTQQGTVSNAPASYDTMLQSAHNKNNR